MRSYIRRCSVLILITAFLIPIPSLGAIGVGVGSGKVSLTESIHPGAQYELPPLPVLNTGDEAADYGVSIEFNEVQSQNKPMREWFSFSPATFHLEPNKSQIVRIFLNLPLKVDPGDYFAYIEAHPVQITHAGQTTIGVAAAAKLYFTVAPSNIFQGIYYRILSFLKHNAPWSYIVIAIFVAACLTYLFRRFFSFNIGISRK